MKKRIALMLFILLSLVMVLASCGDDHTCNFVRDDAKSIAPTCTEEGLLVERCECGEQKTTPLPTVDHEYETTTIEATCETKGEVKEICKLCGEKGPNSSETPALGHDYQADPTNNKLPTCTEGGYDALKCSRCSSTRRANSTEPLGHDWVDDVKWTGAKPDCQTAASGWTYQYCSVCKVENKEFKSEVKSYAVGEYPCDIARDDAHWVQTVTVSCQNDGYTIWACSVCGKIDKLVTETKKSCDFSQPGVVTVPATCYNDRTELRTCAYAEHTINNTKEEPIPGTRLPHTPNVANADCATDKYCKVCAEKVLGEGVIPTADDFADSTICPDASDLNCTFCTYEGKIHLFAAATGAHSGSVTRTVDSTCMQTGRNYHTCANMVEDGTRVCGAEYSNDEDIIPINPTAHKYGADYDKDGAEDKINPATCVAYAYKSKTCENCDLEGTRCTEQITEVTPELEAAGYAPHTFTNAEHTGTIVCENPDCKVALYDSTYTKDTIYDTENKHGEGNFEDFGDGSSLTVTITGTKTETDPGTGKPIDTHIVLNKASASKTVEAIAGANGVTNNVDVIYIETTGDITVTVKVNDVAYTVDENGYVHLNAGELDVTKIELTAETDSDTASAKIYLYSTTIINPQENA